MAFNAEQTKRTRAVIVILLLVAVIALAVVVLSGALTPAGSQGRQASQQSEQMDGNASSSSQAASDDAHTMDDVDATYGTSAKQLKTKYEANPADPSTLLNLANGYFDWGAAAMSHAQGDEDQQHAIDLFKQAISYYDTYIEHNPGSKSAEVDRAICVFYSGDHTAAIAALEEFVAADSLFGPAWANLGMFYENEGRIDDAKDAYNKAIEADPEDTYQVKTYAQQRLANLESTQSDAS